MNRGRTNPASAAKNRSEIAIFKKQAKKREKRS
jgi:hypothetical protein